MRRSWSCRPYGYSDATIWQRGSVALMLGVAALITLSAVARAGGAGDGQALALIKDAMERDYLAIEFNKVENKHPQAVANSKHHYSVPWACGDQLPYLAL